jgi:hypothetical protein
MSVAVHIHNRWLSRLLRASSQRQVSRRAESLDCGSLFSRKIRGRPHVCTKSCHRLVLGIDRPSGMMFIIRALAQAGLKSEAQSGVWLVPRDVVLARRRERRLAQRLAKPVYVNASACCRDGRAGLAYQSAVLGNRVELVRCDDSALAEHLALLMAMRDADQRLSGRIVFRVDCAAALAQPSRGRPALAGVKCEIRGLFEAHPDWSLALVQRLNNRPARCLSTRPFRGDRGRWGS